MKSLRWVLLAALGLVAVALIVAGVKLNSSPEEVAAQAGLYMALDMDITDGGPCADIDDSVVHAVGDPNYGVGICLSGISAALGSFEVSVRYDDTLNQASDVTCTGTCLDSNPDANAGSTTWGTSLGGGWDCSGFGFSPPRGDRDPLTGAGNGEAYIGCWSLTGPWTMGDNETSGTLAVINFHAVAGGADNLTLNNAGIGDTEGNVFGTCNPYMPDTLEMTCVGGTDAKEGTPPPTNTPTITPAATNTPCPNGICPTSTPTPRAWTPTPTPTLDPNTTPALGHEAIHINSTLCLLLTLGDDWNNDGYVDANDAQAALSACNVGLMDEGTMGDLIRILGGDPDDPQPEDFASIDKEMGQMHEVDGKLWVITFVTNDDPIGFYADEGSFPISGGSSLFCGPISMPGYDFKEEDCDDDGDRGDGIVAVMLFPGRDPNPVTPENEAVDRGPATFRVRQGSSEISLGYTVVGEPREIDLSAAEPSIQMGVADCQYPETDAEWSSALADPKKTVLTAQVFDSDGTPVTGAMVSWQSDDAGKADAATMLGVTSDEGVSGIGTRNALCGATTAGVVTITAAITKSFPGGGPTLDPGAREDTDMVQVLVVSPADDVDGDGVLNSEDNCPTGYNPDQENSDALPIDNGPLIPGDDYTVPNDDNLGDVCDIDDDNDQWPDIFEAIGCGSGPTNARGDVSYDDDQDENVAPPMGTDSADNGPSWDTDADEVIDGLECALGSDPKNPASKPPAVPAGDADRDGLPANIEAALGCSDSTPDSDGDTIPDGVEVKGWGTSCASKDTDADWCEDWIEMMDVNGDRNANILDVGWIAKAAFGVELPNPALDVNRDGANNILDAWLVARNSSLVRRNAACP